MLNKFNDIYGKKLHLFMVKQRFIYSKTKESHNFKIFLTKLAFTNARKLIKGCDLLECFCLKSRKK